MTDAPYAAAPVRWNPSVEPRDNTRLIVGGLVAAGGIGGLAWWYNRRRNAQAAAATAAAAQQPVMQPSGQIVPVTRPRSDFRSATDYSAWWQTTTISGKTTLFETEGRPFILSLQAVLRGYLESPAVVRSRVLFGLTEAGIPQAVFSAAALGLLGATVAGTSIVAAGSEARLAAVMAGAGARAGSPGVAGFFSEMALGAAARSSALHGAAGISGSVGLSGVMSLVSGVHIDIASDWAGLAVSASDLQMTGRFDVPTMRALYAWRREVERSVRRPSGTVDPLPAIRQDAAAGWVSHRTMVSACMAVQSAVVWELYHVVPTLPDDAILPQWGVVPPPPASAHGVRATMTDLQGMQTFQNNPTFPDWLTP